jgi:hypothetical protein
MLLWHAYVVEDLRYSVGKRANTEEKPRPKARGSVERATSEWRSAPCREASAKHQKRK